MKNITTLFLLLVSLCLQGQDFDRAKMDRFFDVLAEKDQAMGTLSIYQDGKMVYEKSMGYLDLEQKIGAKPQSKYRIGSISKTFTAIVIMQMVEEQKLSLDQPLAQYFPTVPNADKINIEQLLRHRSGLFNLTNQEDFSTWMEKEQSQASLLQRIVDNGTVFAPGEKTEYSNTNYVLLSWIAEQIDQQKFAQIIDQRIVQKCGLKSTFLGGKINVDDNQARSYYKTMKWMDAPETDMSIPLGAGAMVSTAGELNQMLTQLFAGKLVSETSLAQMSTMVEGIGMGLFIIPFHERQALGHNGRIDGFQSMAAHFKAENTTISYISNGIVYPFNDILIGALSIYFGKDFEIPDFKPGIELKSEDLDDYLGTYSSKDLPLKITISKEGNQLLAQATGQSAFPLDATEQHKFRFAPAGVVLEFTPSNKQMTLFQGGGTFVFTLE